jgi:hypothetical protein
MGKRLSDADIARQMKRFAAAVSWMTVCLGLAGCVTDYHPPPPDPMAPTHDNGGSGGGGSM